MQLDLIDDVGTVGTGNEGSWISSNRDEGKEERLKVTSIIKDVE